MKMPKLNITLELECWSDELSPAQIAAYEKAEAEHAKAKEKIAELISSNEGEEILSGSYFNAYSLAGTVDVPEELCPKEPVKVEKKAVKTEVKNKRKTPVIPQDDDEDDDDDDDDEDVPLAKRITRSRDDDDVPLVKRSTRSRDDDEDIPLAKRFARNKEKQSPTIAAAKPQVYSKDKKGKPSRNSDKEKVSSPSFRPTEINSIGGLTVGVEKKEEEKTGPDSKEMTFNKLQGKTFPSLVVTARPSLRVKEAPSGERSTLDSKVKIVLMLTPAKFTEWLIQQGLLKSAQQCAVHSQNELKLGRIKSLGVFENASLRYHSRYQDIQPIGVYSDGSKFPYSGGYVWISECCPTRFVSVFYGSIFEGAPNPPSCILKLIYHWSCQTNIQNVVQWVKVDNLYIKNIYTWLRAVCTVSLHQHFKPMGGTGKHVEVGVISLGTTTQDGQQRQVKVEVLGVLDHSTRSIRLKAIEPFSDADRNYKKRFQKILEPLGGWVLKDSVLSIDMTVDKSTLVGMGFKNVVQSPASDTSAKYTNSTVMDYLRRTVPRMFQNTLSLLSKQMIQQFLDELAWRESYGTYPLQTFDNITSHIAELTKVDTHETLIQRLFQAATNPFNDWSVPEASTSSSSSLLSKDVSPSGSQTARRGRKPINKDPSQSILRTESQHKPTIKKEPKEENENLYNNGDDKPSNNHTSIRPKNTELTSSSSKSTIPIELKRIKKEIDINKTDQKILKDKLSSSSNQLKSIILKGHKGLEDFYYGSLDGHDMNFETPLNFQAACPICKEVFESNIELQTDLILHADEGNDYSFQCRYCLDKFDNDHGIRKHDALMHPQQTKIDSSCSYHCIICQNRFNSVQLLIMHLQKTHVSSELPYKCSGCGYRSSSHRDIINHFYTDHNGANFVQCPFCLVIFKIFKNNECITKNIDMYFLHIQKHLVKAQNKKCNKCALSFLSKGLLRYHQMFDHHSLSRNKHVKKLVDTSYAIEPPRNRGHLVKEVPPYENKMPYPPLILNFENELCLECDTELQEENHIIGVLKCLKCRYQTCCLKAMLDHTSSCPPNVNPESNVHIQLDREMHCICGFSSSDGNSLARHLAVCEQKSAYPSVEAAQDNTVKRNMLDMLGLVRRDEEDISKRNPELTVIESL